MLDFTSSLYLGFRHPSHALEPWEQLTLAKPAVLGEPRQAAAIADALAALTGCERATLLPSTLHLFFDLFEVLRRDGIRLYLDAAAYPMLRWGCERAAAQGVPVRRFPHNDAATVARMVAEDARSGLIPIIVADGFCPLCGRAAPLRHYLEIVEPYGSYVVIDDTQALGIWGKAPGARFPYGFDGGGSLRGHAIASPRIIVGSSLAKAFGVPLAALAGNARLIDHFEENSETRVHASPPSIADLRAAEHALRLNATHGDAARDRLARLVAHFRRRVRALGLRAPRSLFPVQALDLGADAVRVHSALRDAGVATAVVLACDGRAPRLVFVISAAHTMDDLDQAAIALRSALR